MIRATIVADSVTPLGKRITTFELEYHRFIHGEVMTHRVFSRNAMSSRAIPVKRTIEQVRNDPATPLHWGKNQAGMQANEQLTGDELYKVQMLWREAAIAAADIAEKMTELGAHKQVANRILEPFQWMRTLVTTTETYNFYSLRNHKDAEPHFQLLAQEMLFAQDNSTPRLCEASHGPDVFSWHLPYISLEEKLSGDCNDADFIMSLVKISVARCARVSYLTHGGDKPRFDEDMQLYERLVGAKPRHSSPTEHQAYPAPTVDHVSNNFRGWYQYRQYVDESDAT